MQSKRQKNSWDDPFCMTLNAQCVRLAMARRDRSWDTILEVLCLPKSAPPPHKDKIYGREVLPILHEQKAVNRRWFLAIPSEHSQTFCSVSLQRPHSVSYFWFQWCYKIHGLLPGIREGSNFKIDSVWKEEQRETKETNFLHTIIIPEFHIYPVHHKL